MLIGHYGPSFAGKAYGKTVPLWVLFLAVQLVDIAWSILVLLGIEKVRIVPGITATNPFDLYYMPYTHALPAALVWSFVAAMAYRLLMRVNDWLSVVIVGAAVFSHWVLDLLVHRPDLPLYDNAYKVGLGLWDYPAFAFALECALMFGGIFLYIRTTKPLDNIGRYGMVIFGLIAAVMQAYIFFGPPPTSPESLAATALVVYAIFAAVAYWLEQKRS